MSYHGIKQRLSHQQGGKDPVQTGQDKLSKRGPRILQLALTEDKADENAEFIFERNVGVTKANIEGTNFHEPNVQSLKEKSNGFFLTYIKWENQGE